MAINKNHEFEELDGIKCGIVERKVGKERVDFLKTILEASGYTVVISSSPPPKASVPIAEGETPPPAEPETFTVGVTDYTFNTTNALFGRVLKTPNGKIVTPAYWYGKEAILDDTKPYYLS